ncbi:hypothetical protein BH10BAC1_BH10BAC1_19720 [soil metagenome]
MKKYLFITTLTPKELLSPLRSELFFLYLAALKGQSYNEWEAILIGEEDRVDGNIKYVKANAVSKSDKLKVAYEYLLTLESKPDYIIRLDDDDIISPLILTDIALANFDCYADKFHLYYDLVSGDISQQERNWLPNTIIHKYEHALAIYGESNLPLFMQDHSQAWHVYYQNKKVLYTPKHKSIYLRIISPTTITSKMNQLKSSSYLDMDMNSYGEYLKTFGKWRYFNANDFKAYQNKLINIWETFSKQKIKLKKKTIFNFFK